MRKIIFVLLGVIFLVQLISAEIIINTHPNKLYNLGDTVEIPLKLTSSIDSVRLFTTKLICEGVETEIYKEFVSFSAGEEKLRSPEIPLIRNFIGNSIGTCKIKASLGEDYALSRDFEISDLVNLEIEGILTEVNPEEDMYLKGVATKENGELVNGFVKLSVVIDNSSENINILDTVNLGVFDISFFFPKNAKAGQYLVKLDIYEEESDSGEISNKGFVDYNIKIKQVPTSLEILFKNSEVEPGTNLMVKAILHDQTGEKINSVSTITIKNGEDEILQQVENPTDVFFEYLINYNEAPAEWRVFALSERLESGSSFKIKEKEDVRVELINKTLHLTNIGNVPYTKIIIVKIGNDFVNINTTLSIDETKKYLLTAPDGEYEIEVLTSSGESKITGFASLTGSSIDVKEALGIIEIVRYPFVWIFIIGILGFIAFMFFKKGYKRSFFGYIKSKKLAKKIAPHMPIQRKSIINPRNKAELSLSLKGDKHDVSLVCLNIKNLDDLEERPEGSVKETIEKILDNVESNKGIVYQNQNNLFFIVSPMKTKTFKNERKVIELAQEIKSLLNKHNKMFKQKIEFGISLNNGSIIAKQESDSGKIIFMSLGTLITSSKKISSISNGEILLSTKMKEKTMNELKTESHKKDGVEVHTIKEVRHKEDNKRFIGEFMKRMEK